MSALRRWCALALMAVGLGAGAAEQVDPAVPAATGASQAEQELLYLDALKALADGRPEEATGKLGKLLEKNALHAGAWLDLAISHCELGNKAEALRLFAAIEERFQPTQAIRDLIDNYRKSGCHGTAGAQRTVSVKLGRAHETNVNQGASTRLINIGSGADMRQVELGPDSLPQADYYNMLSLDLSQPLGSRGMLIIGQLRALRHDTVRRQDSQSVLLGLERPWRAGAWHGRITAAAGIVHLDDVLYQRQGQMLLRVTPPVGLPSHLDWSVGAGYSRAIYPTRTYYDATTLDVNTSLAVRGERSSTRLSLGTLADHGRTERPGGNRQGWYTSVGMVGLLGAGLVGEAGMTHQVWHSDDPYSPGLIDATRRQKTSQARASVLYPLGRYGALQLEYRRTWNRENIPLFQYDSRMLQFSWRKDNW